MHPNARPSISFRNTPKLQLGDCSPPPYASDFLSKIDRHLGDVMRDAKYNAQRTFLITLTIVAYPQRRVRLG